MLVINYILSVTLKPTQTYTVTQIEWAQINGEQQVDK